MSRLIDRCLILAAGGLLGFAAAQATDRAEPSNDAVGPPSVGLHLAAGATPDPRQDAASADPEMDELVDAVVRRRPSDAPRRPGPLSDDEVDRCLVVARDIDSALHDGLLALQEADPEAFRERLADSRRLRYLAKLRQDEPHLYELKLIELRTDREVVRLSDEVRDAAIRGDTATVASLRPQLVGQMRMQQAFILLAKRQTLDRMRDRLDLLERTYQQELATVDERIQARVDQLASGDRSAADGADGGG